MDDELKNHTHEFEIWAKKRGLNIERAPKNRNPKYYNPELLYFNRDTCVAYWGWLGCDDYHIAKASKMVEDSPDEIGQLQEGD